MRSSDGDIALEGKPERIVLDDSLIGFGVRIRAGGARRYIFQYKQAGKSKRITLKAREAKPARQEAAKLAARVTLGSDPAAERNAQRAATEETFGKVLARYWSLPDRRRESSRVQVKRHLFVYLEPLHRMPVKMIDRRRVASEMSRITDNHGAYAANRARASLSRFFAWMVGEGLVDFNVVLGTNVHPEVARDRVLSDIEPPANLEWA